MVIETTRLFLIIIKTMTLAIVAHGEHAWLIINILKLIHFEILAEWIVIGHTLRVCRENYVSQLYAVLW
jgi:hypothetical protein